jgi:hypothetical protein
MDGAIESRRRIGTGLVYGFAPSDRKGRFHWLVSDEGQIALRGEEFSALIHGLEVRSERRICCLWGILRQAKGAR